jgi:archaellum component FlaG (FlaF/FlaG flagellin family)
MRWIVTLLLAFCSVTACNDDSVIRVGGEVSPGLIADASIKCKSEPFRLGGVKNTGWLIIGNTSDATISYSNSRLRLNIDGHTAKQTYVDSLASHIVDVGDVDIAPGETLEFNAYWVLPESIGKSWSDGEVSLSFSQ